MQVQTFIRGLSLHSHALLCACDYDITHIHVHDIVDLHIYHCLSNSSRCIQLFSLLAKGPHGGFTLAKEYEIKHLKSAPLCIDYVMDPEHADVAYLVWGDSDGRRLCQFLIYAGLL